MNFNFFEVLHQYGRQKKKIIITYVDGKTVDGVIKGVDMSLKLIHLFVERPKDDNLKRSDENIYIPISSIRNLKEYPDF